MKIGTVLSGLLMLAAFGVAEAHVHLKSSIPAEGAVVSPAPTQVVLNFTEPALVTALWIQQGNEPRRKLGPLSSKPQATVTVATAGLKPGKYVLTWRAVSPDQHVMSGQLHFTVG